MKETELSQEWQKAITEQLEESLTNGFIDSSRGANGHIWVNKIYYTLCDILDISFDPGEGYKMDLVYDFISKWIEENIPRTRIILDKECTPPLLVMDELTNQGWIYLHNEDPSENMEDIVQYIRDRSMDFNPTGSPSYSPKQSPFYLDFEGFSLKIKGEVEIILDDNVNESNQKRIE